MKVKIEVPRWTEPIVMDEEIITVAHLPDNRLIVMGNLGGRGVFEAHETTITITR